MSILDARRVVIDFSSHDPRIVKRLADAATREYAAILQEHAAQEEVAILPTKFFYPRWLPAWGTISYKLDPATQLCAPPPEPKFEAGRLARVNQTCNLPSAVGRIVRLVGKTGTTWDVVAPDGKNFGVYESSLDLLP